MKFIANVSSRLDRFLTSQLEGVSRSRVAKWIDDNQVLVDGQFAKPSLFLKLGQTVEVLHAQESEPHDLTPHSMHLDIRYEDEYLLVVNKPRGLATHPARSLKEPSLVNALLGRGDNLSSGSATFRPGIVHRLDRDTTGLLVVAKNDDVHTHLARQIQKKTANRKYLAVLAGALTHSKAKIEAPIGRDPHNRLKMSILESGKSAVTHLRKLNQFHLRLVSGGQVGQGLIVSTVELELETGRTHQIRVHVAALGHAVVGDRLYGHKDLTCYPLQLHAAYLSFDHPVTGLRIEVSCPAPEDFLGQVEK